MIDRITSHWWLFLIRGLLALALGIAVPFFQVAAIFAIAILVGAYCFADGVVAIVAAFRMSHAGGSWWWLVLEGILGIAVGVVTFFYPGITIFALAYLVGAWAIVTGVLSIASAIRLRQHVPNEWLWMIGAVLSIIFGILVYIAPVFGLLFIVWMVSIYAILAGIFFIWLAFRLRAHAPLASGGSPTTT
jgi:uncharacterized membrane protein HdeD (DUF308 family)